MLGQGKKLNNIYVYINTCTKFSTPNFSSGRFPTAPACQRNVPRTFDNLLFLNTCLGARLTSYSDRPISLTPQECIQSSASWPALPILFEERGRRGRAIFFPEKHSLSYRIMIGGTRSVRFTLARKCPSRQYGSVYGNVIFYSMFIKQVLIDSREEAAFVYLAFNYEMTNM